MKGLRLSRNLALAALAVGFLSGCSSKNKDCPLVAPLAEAVSLSEFRQGAPVDLANVLYTVQIVDVSTDCDVDKAGHTIDSSIDIKFRATRAPNGAAEGHTVPYFVVLLGKGGKIVAKYPYSVEFSFEPGQATADFEDTVDSTVIKLGEGEKYYDYALYVGLQLNKQQLDYNRTLGHFAQ